MDDFKTLAECFRQNAHPNIAADEGQRLFSDTCIAAAKKYKRAVEAGAIEAPRCYAAMCDENDNRPEVPFPWPESAAADLPPWKARQLEDFLWSNCWRQIATILGSEHPNLLPEPYPMRAVSESDGVQVCVESPDDWRARARHSAEICDWLANHIARASAGGGTPIAAGSKMSVTDLATKHTVGPEALRKRLDTWRLSHDEGYHEVKSRRPQDPKYLYDEAAVLPVIEQLKAKRTSGKRPARKKAAL